MPVLPRRIQFVVVSVFGSGSVGVIVVLGVAVVVVEEEEEEEGKEDTRRGGCVRA